MEGRRQCLKAGVLFFLFSKAILAGHRMLVPGLVRTRPRSLSVAKNKGMYQMANLIFIPPEVSESPLHRIEFGRCSHGKA